VTIHLKPRSRTAWTTLSMKRLGPSPERKNGGGGGGAPAQDAAHGQGRAKNA
jgi:hypothetical protein